MPAICGVVRPDLEDALSAEAIAPVMVGALPGVLVAVLDGALAEATVEIDEVGIGIHMELSVAITMVLTSSVELGTPMEGGKVVIVEAIEVELPRMVAVIVRAVLG
jgi:hypothetical protein